MSAQGRAAGLAYRHAGDPADPPVLLLHGYPESSYMWHEALGALADAGWHAIAPDFAGFGDSEPDPPGTWERHIEKLERFVQELCLGPAALVTHDWGVLIGLRWACDHPERVSSLVISDGGFFSDRRWHDLANAMRTPGTGEELISGFTREGLAGALQAISPGMGDDAIDEYWKGFDGDTRRLGHLELYRSGDFEKLAPYDGRLGTLGLPALILWGEDDQFAKVTMAERFRSELPGSEMIVLAGAGHFVWDDRPAEASAALIDFLQRRARPGGPG